MFDEIFAPFYTTEWGRRLSLAALILASLMLIYTGYDMIINWRQDFQTPTTPVTTSSSTSDHLQQIIEQIPNNHLFGTALTSKTTHIPITSLQLHLTGIIKSVRGGPSTVIISEGNNPGKIYQVGDVLPSGVRIHSISHDGVILENAGQLEKLPLLRTPLEFKSAPQPMSLPFVSHESTNAGEH